MWAVCPPAPGPAGDEKAGGVASALAVLSQAALRWGQVPPGPEGCQGRAPAARWLGALSVSLSPPHCRWLWGSQGQGPVLVKVTGVALQRHKQNPPNRQSRPVSAPARPARSSCQRQGSARLGAEASSLPGTLGLPRPGPRGPLSHQRCLLARQGGLEDTACGPPGVWASQNGNRRGRPASVVMGPLLWAALRVRTDRRRALRELGRGRWSPRAPPRAGTRTGTGISQLQVRGLNSKGRLRETQTVGRKGRQELSSGGRGRSSKDWSGASGAVLVGGSPAGGGGPEAGGVGAGVDQIPGCVLRAPGAVGGCG